VTVATVYHRMGYRGSPIYPAQIGGKRRLSRISCRRTTQGVTCGREIADWAAEKNELLETILDEILLCAITHTGKHMTVAHALEKLP